MGENGILKQASNAKKQTEEAQKNEQEHLKQIEDYINLINQDKYIKHVNIPNVNLYNKEEMKIGYYVLNGTEGTNANYMSTGYIAVEPGDILFWCAYLPEYEKFDYEFITQVYYLQYTQYISMYDSNKNFIESISAPKATFDTSNNNEADGYTVPDGVHYLRLTFVTTNGRSELADTLFICKNEPPKYYAEYNEKTATINYSLYLPSKIQISAGSSFNIYNTNICPALYNEDLTFTWKSDIGTSDNNGITFNPTSDNIGNHMVSVLVYDKSNNLVASTSTNIEIVSNTIEQSKNILLIGDSLSNGKPWINRVEELSENKIDLTVFAASGAPAYSYYLSDTVAGVDNPFYNSELGHFDYKYYLENNNVNFDEVILFLGTNDMNFRTSYYPYINNESIKLKAIVDNIKEYNPNLPIYVITPMTTVDNYFRSRTAFNLCKDFYSTFNTYENLNIIPIELTVDSTNDFGESDKIHPLDSGYEKIANTVYSVICANQ